MANYISVSPDGRNTIDVETTDYGGPGTAAIMTSARLWVPNAKPIPLLTLEHRMLSTAGVNTVWSSPTDVEIHYYGARVDYFRPAVGGIHISLHDISLDAGASNRSGTQLKRQN